MTTTTATETRPCDDASPRVRSQHYTELLSWPTTIEPETGEVRLHLGDAIDALVMRAGFGAEVNHQLVQAMMRVPIIVVSDKKVVDWIFLTLPRTPMRQSTIADLVTAHVRWYKAGNTIALPASGATEGDLYWLQQPEADAELPAWGAVVGAARRTFTRAW